MSKDFCLVGFFQLYKLIIQQLFRKDGNNDPLGQLTQLVEIRLELQLELNNSLSHSGTQNALNKF